MSPLLLLISAARFPLWSPSFSLNASAVSPTADQEWKQATTVPC